VCAQVFFLELVVPFGAYSLIGAIPVRVITGVPELVCAGVVASQSAVCVLAQMRFLLPLVLYLSAPPPGEAAPDAEAEAASA
jgi:hypothetical protein